MNTSSYFYSLFFYTDTSTTDIYTLSLHDALPIFQPRRWSGGRPLVPSCGPGARAASAPGPQEDRKSTRLNSSHRCISYAVFCLKKKKNKETNSTRMSSCQ